MPHPHGPSHPSTTLTWPAVRQLRALYSTGTGIRALSRIYHLDPHTIFDIVHHHHWWPDDSSTSQEDPTPTGLGGPDPTNPLQEESNAHPEH